MIISETKLGLFTRLFCLGSHISRPQLDEIPSSPTDPEPSKITSTTTEHNDDDHHLTWMRRMIRNYYAPFLMKRSTQIGVLFLYMGYLAISIYGCTNIHQGLEPARLLVKDSYASKYMDAVSYYFFKKGM